MKSAGLYWKEWRSDIIGSWRHCNSRQRSMPYPYDEQQKKRFKTVELIVEESDWEPHVRPRMDESSVPIRMALSEVEVRSQVKRVGGRWDAQRRVWKLRYNRKVQAFEKIELSIIKVTKPIE